MRTKSLRLWHLSRWKIKGVHSFDKNPLKIRNFETSNYFHPFFKKLYFKDVIGHQALKHRLIKTVRENRIPHAQLFWGPEGGGNLALALAFAQYANCLNRGAEDACGRCSSCIKAEKFVHPDFHFTYPTIGSKEVSSKFAAEWREVLLDNPYLNAYEWLQHLGAENKQGNITTAECAKIVKELKLTAVEARYKVQIIWMAEYLGKESNKLLKIIEEPPTDTLFILIVNNRSGLLQTILSRTQHVHVPRLPDVEIAQYLQKKHGLSEENARRLTVLAEGNLNKARRLLSQIDTDIPDFFNECHVLMPMR